MGQTDIERTLDEYAQAKNRRDVEGALALCHDDCFYESVGIPGRVEGKEALRGFYGALFDALPDYYGEFDGRAIDGETVVVWGRFGGTASGEFMGVSAAGGRVEVPVTFVCSFRDGLIASDVGYFDAASLFEQAGVSAEDVAGIIGTGSPAPRAAADAERRAAAWVERFAERWAAPVPERFADLLHPDTRNLYPYMDEPADQAGVVDWFRMILGAVPDLTLEVVRWAATGDGVLIEWSATGTVGGDQMSWQGADRFKLEHDRCVEGRAYFDSYPLREALAAAQEPVADAA